MIQALLGTQWTTWKSQFASDLDIGEDKAGPVLAEAAQQVMGLFTQGKLDVQKVQTPEGASDLLNHIDTVSMAQMAGVEKGKVESALGELLPSIIQQAGAMLGGGSGLSDMLGNLNTDQS